MPRETRLRKRCVGEGGRSSLSKWAETIRRWRRDNPGADVRVSSAQEIEGCGVASLEDIGAGNLATISHRSIKRDYVDLHAVLTMDGVSMGFLVDVWKRRFMENSKGDV